ncbi:MAG TPA: RluA family pseudouridine synthase [Candidatus Binatia bacterium]|jgi:tRNA pseudouridine32 synthase/23S rRNA pseudouridine746 synthase/23S rRNA pseudouridine1911/1915/1917 synthase
MRNHSRSGAKRLPGGLSILYEDRDILVVDKPAGLLTIATDKEKSRTAYFILTDYVRKGYSKSRNRIFIVHRLDRETSGILLFAKTAEAKLALQSQWKTTEKKYLAVVHGRCERQSETITNYLAENKAHFVYSTSDTKNGKLSQTGYKVLKEASGLTLLEVRLLTGRKHQIRVHLADIGHAVVGDQKYGKEDRAHTRLALHALSLSFKHPFSGKQIAFETEVPAYLIQLVGSWNRGVSKAGEPNAGLDSSGR